METFDYKRSKQKAKQLYKQGKLQEFLDFIVADTQKGAKDAGNLLSHGDACLYQARVQMEYGLFPEADKNLAQLNQLLTSNSETFKQSDSAGFFKLQCKLYHTQTKNFIRANYLQKGFDYLSKHIALLEKVEDVELQATKVKYLCKLYEALAHLYCDPYCFSEGEKELQKAEKLYQANEDKLERGLYRKFLIKKSSYSKKSGFFIEAMEILRNLEKEILEEMKKPSPKHDEAKQLKKLYHKVLRDQARLHGLRRQEKEATELHNRAEKILKEDVYQGVKNNIKIAKLQLIKGLWMAKFSLDKSNDELLTAYSLFFELAGTQNNYFGANCLLEVGSNHLKESHTDIANGFIYKAYQTFCDVFGKTHPLLQKYYSYSSEVAAHIDSGDSLASTDFNDAVLLLSEQQLQLSQETNNICEDGEPSIFTLDPLVSHISMLASNKEKIPEAQEKIIEAEHVFGIRGLSAGTQLLHSLNTVKSLLLIKQEKLKEAMSTLEQSYESQVKVLKGNRAHPFLEHSISQLGLLYRVNQQFEKAEEMYLNQLKIKELYYGPESETMIMPLRNLGQTYIYMENQDQAKQVLERAIKIGRAAIKKDDKLKPKIGDQVIDIYALLYGIYDQQKKFQDAQFISSDQLEFAVETYGEKSPQYAAACFNKARTLMMVDGSDMAECKQQIMKSIEIEEELQQNKTVKSAILGRYLYCAGTIFSALHENQEALDYFRKSQTIVKMQPGLEALTEELNQHIKMCEEQVGEVSVAVSATNNQTDLKQSRAETNSNSSHITDMVIAGAAISVALGALTFAYLKLRGK